MKYISHNTVLLKVILCVLGFISAWPIYIDLASGKFVQLTYAEMWTSAPTIPLPLIFFCLPIALILISLTGNLSKPALIVSPVLVRYFIITISFISLLLLLVVGVPPTRYMQSLLPLVFVFFIPRVDFRIYRIFLIYSLLGLFAFQFHHILDLVYGVKNNSFVDLTSLTAREFVALGQFDIYAGLTSYPAVIILSIPLTCLLSLSRSFIFNSYTAPIFFAPVIIYSLMFSRVTTFLLVLIFLLLVLFWCLPRIRPFTLILYRSRLLSLFIILSSLLIFVNNFSAFARIAEAFDFLFGAELTASVSSRGDHWSSFLDWILENPFAALLGSNTSAPPNFHNAAFDYIYYIGIVPLSSILFMLYYPLRALVSIFRHYISFSWLAFSSLAIFLSSLIVDNLFNANITQPYYFFYAYMFVVGVVSFEAHVSLPKSRS